GTPGPIGPAGATGPTGPSGRQFDVLINGTSIADPSQDLAYLGFTGQGPGFLTSQNYRFDLVATALKSAFVLYSGPGCTGTARLFSEAGQTGVAFAGEIVQANGAVVYVPLANTAAPFAWASFFNFGTGNCDAASPGPTDTNDGIAFQPNSSAVTGYAIANPNNLVTTFQRQ
ncbi:MAG: hypothetical protein AAGJ52_13605, partial [Pseudomonadota bacterium]